MHTHIYESQLYPNLCRIHICNSFVRNYFLNNSKCCCNTSYILICRKYGSERMFCARAARKFDHSMMIGRDAAATQIFVYNNKWTYRKWAVCTVWFVPQLIYKINEWAWLRERFCMIAVIQPVALSMFVWKLFIAVKAVCLCKYTT